MATEKWVRLDKPSNSTSAVWETFGFPVYEARGIRKTDKSNVICKMCNMSLKYNGNTTNMQKHISRHHPVHSSLSSNSSSSGASTSNFTSTSVTEKTEKVQNEIVQPKATPQAHVERASISCMIIRKYWKIGMFIAKDLRPLSIVDNKYFRDVSSLDSRYSLPSRKYFSEKVIPQLYNEAREKVKREIKEAEFVALTTDSWTSRACESYITITAHFMTTDWAMKSYVLQTRKLDASHTGVNIGSVLKDAVKEWELPNDKDIALVTDNASNMDIAAKEAGLHPHIGCFAHTVNLACQRGLKVASLGRLLGRIRKIVTFFHRSTTATAVLRLLQKQLSLHDHKLVQDVQTRWNSSYDMIQRYLEQEPAIHAAFQSNEVKKNIKDVVTLSNDDIREAEHVMKVLEPLKTVTNIMCAEHTPTVSLIYPMQEIILENMVRDDLDSHLVQNVKQSIRQDLNKRYRDDGTESFLLMCAALDPRFRSLPKLEPDLRDKVYEDIEMRVITLGIEPVKVKAEPEADTDVDLCVSPPLPLLPDEDNLNNNLPEQPKLAEGHVSVDAECDLCPPPAKKSAIEQLLGDVYVVSVTPGKTIEERTKSEIANYRKQPSIPLNSCPLLWWKNSEEQFPLIARLARKVLIIPSTSVSSERVFSTAGDIVTATRSALSPEHVDQLIFTKKNL